MIRLLLGGSPCTHWSIAQKNNRETQPEGLGWELFKNYLIAKEKFKPDFFLYENNKSAAEAIKAQISSELGVPLMYINSALVSAQNRERFYCFNWVVKQPKDRGILLKDIIESGLVDREKAYCLKHQAGNARDYLKKHHTQVAFEPVRIGDIGTTAQAHRVYSSYGKSVTLKACSGGQGGKTGLYLVPINTKPSGKPEDIPIYRVHNGEITYKDKSYSINLPDGYYIIRKLTPIECERLQTLPDNYTYDVGIPETERYKCLGNGWTAEVIIHILKGALRDVPKSEPIEVLSMYDGIATGRYCLDKLGFKNVRYYSYEIDCWARRIATKNYSDIIQCGDAFQLRAPDWIYSNYTKTNRRLLINGTSL